MKEFFASKWFIAGMVGVMGILWLRSINKASQAQANYDAVNARAAQAAADAAAAEATAAARAAGEAYDRANESFDEAQAALDRAKELLRQG
jgi:multidrug resistance efflux pump